MSQKISFEETCDYFIQAGLEILDIKEAKGIDYKYKCKNKQGYLFSRSLRSVMRQIKNNKTDNIHLFSNKNPYFYENMLHYINVFVNNGTILLTLEKEIKNIDQPLTFRCGECGREFHTTWHLFYKKQEKCCNFCFNRKKATGEINTKHQDSNIFHEKAKERGLIILDGPQIKYKDKVNVQDEEGYRGVMSASRIMTGSSFERFSVRNPFTIDNLRLYVFKKKWDCIIYNQSYLGDKMPLRMLCSCGREFYVDTNHFVEGKFQCNECRVKQSHIAKLVQLYLETKQISYVKEKTFSNCINKKPLPFDFFLLDYNACIEVDGIGHYRPVPFNGKKEEAEKIFNQRQKNDNIKTEYCKKNNIPLLRLPFWIIEKDEYTEPIDNFILSIKSNDLNK